VVLSISPTHADIDDSLVLAGAFGVGKWWKVDWKEEATLGHRIQPALSAFCVIVTSPFGAFFVHNAKAIGRLVNPGFEIPSFFLHYFLTRICLRTRRWLSSLRIIIDVISCSDCVCC
jgi:hypothetical protein